MIALPQLSGQRLLPYMLDGRPPLNATDLSIFDEEEELEELSCRVDKIDPILSFDFRFHAGYNLEIPLDELSGEHNRLTMIFRVTPTEPEGAPFYFVQGIRVPSIPEDAEGDTELSGTFDLGEGKYDIAWMARDAHGNRCTDYWDLEADLSRGQQDIQMEIAPGTAEESRGRQFLPEPLTERTPGASRHIKFLVNVAPQDQDSSALQSLDTLGVIMMMRRMMRNPEFTRFSVVAFNMEDQEIFYRQPETDEIDFPSLGKAVRKVEPGTVKLDTLEDKHSETKFLRDLILKEMEPPAEGGGAPDVIIFAGPKHLLDDNIDDDDLKPLAKQVHIPVFYVNYNLIPKEVPWRDGIGNAIRVFDGKEYAVHRPRDLQEAIADMVDRIVNSKQ